MHVQVCTLYCDGWFDTSLYNCKHPLHRLSQCTCARVCAICSLALGNEVGRGLALCKAFVAGVARYFRHEEDRVSCVFSLFLTEVGVYVCVCVCIRTHTHAYTLTKVLTQALLQHVDQCMRHEDVMKQIMLARLARILVEWHCNSFTDLIEEMELWDWNVANQDFWPQLARSLHSHKVSVTWAEKMDKKLASVLIPEKMSCATATRSIRKCKTRI